MKDFKKKLEENAMYVESLNLMTEKELKLFRSYMEPTFKALESLHDLITQSSGSNAENEV